MSGNSLLKIGLNNREIKLMSPPFSPIFMMPNHKERTPVNPNAISNAVFEALKVELMISGKTCVSPKKINRPIATTKAIKKNDIQI
jgi:hypothetical protein